MDFVPFPKIPRLKRTVVITEKLDGTNASIHIGESGEFLIGSRNRFITPESDNYGFAAWSMDNREELLKLGPGRHYGEWWGRGIGRGYDRIDRQFSLFNTARWDNNPGRPTCCSVVPVMAVRDLGDGIEERCLDRLKTHGSVAVPGFMRPEGIVIYHSASKQYYKRTLEHDDLPKGLVDACS